MAQQYPALSDKIIDFIGQQKIFFVATAGVDTRVNVSPKGMDSLRVLSSNRVIWLNVTGSGNETAAHVQELPRMTIMFCAYEGAPLILRLYGQAKVYHKGEADYESLIGHFEPLPGGRQIFDLNVDLVQTSCGMAVPFFDYVDERNQLKDWAAKQGEEGIAAYWQKKNQYSIDDKPTYIMTKNSD
jgi:hypothetical protein